MEIGCLPPLQSVDIAITCAIINRWDALQTNSLCRSSRSMSMVWEPLQYHLQPLRALILKEGGESYIYLHRVLCGGGVAGRYCLYYQRDAMEALDFILSSGDTHMRFRDACAGTHVLTTADSPWVTRLEILVRVTNIMRINCCTLTQWKIIGCHETGSAFELKEEVIGPPETNLGGTIQGVELDDETKCLKIWIFSVCVQTSVKNVEDHCTKQIGICTARSETILLTRDLNPDEALTSTVWSNSMVDYWTESSLHLHKVVTILFCTLSRGTTWTSVSRSIIIPYRIRPIKSRTSNLDGISLAKISATQLWVE